MNPPNRDGAARQHFGEPSPFPVRGERSNRPRGPKMAEVEGEIAGLVDRSTHELRLAWRKLHHAGPPVGLSRDLMIRTLANKIAGARPWRPKRRAAAPPSDPGQSIRERSSFFRSRCRAEDGRQASAGVGWAYPYCPRGRGRVRVRESALSLPDHDRGTDHRRALVWPSVLRHDEANLPFAITTAGARP